MAAAAVARLPETFHSEPFDAGVAMISFEPDIHDDAAGSCLQVWADTPSGRVRCRATYSFLADRLGASDKDDLLAGAAQAFEDLKPLYEDAIKRADFVQGTIKTIEFS